MTFALLALVLASPRFVAPVSGGWTTQASARVYVAGQRGGTLSVGDAGVPCVEVPLKGDPLDGAVVLAHCAAPLQPGPNTLRFVDGEGAVEATYTRAETTSHLEAGVGPGFGPGGVHRPEAEEICAGCHALGDRHDGGVCDAGLPVHDGTCVNCHAALTARKKQHGPVGQGACLACHDANSTPRYAVRWPIQDTCFSCHADLKATMERSAFRHGPAAAGRCTTCHDPHGSDEVFWLKKRPFDLCTNCHTEKRTERHVVVGFVYGDSHPLQGRPHPIKRNTEFACPACHNPHAAQARFLWQFDATDRETLCRTCHVK
jgi:predicted CXXCH cytochrome family protein